MSALARLQPPVGISRQEISVGRNDEKRSQFSVEGGGISFEKACPSKQKTKFRKFGDFEKISD